MMVVMVVVTMIVMAMISVAFTMSMVIAVAVIVVAHCIANMVATSMIAMTMIFVTMIVVPAMSMIFVPTMPMVAMIFMPVIMIVMAVAVLQHRLHRHDIGDGHRDFHRIGAQRARAAYAHDQQQHAEADQGAIEQHQQPQQQIGAVGFHGRCAQMENLRNVEQQPAGQLIHGE